MAGKKKSVADLQDDYCTRIFAGAVPFPDITDVYTAAAFAVREAARKPPNGVRKAMKQGWKPWAEISFVACEAIRAVRDGELPKEGDVTPAWWGGELPIVRRNAFLDWAIDDAGQLALRVSALKELKRPAADPLADENDSVRNVWAAIQHWTGTFGSMKVQNETGYSETTVLEALRRLIKFDLVEKLRTRGPYRVKSEVNNSL